MLVRKFAKKKRKKGATLLDPSLSPLGRVATEERGLDCAARLRRGMGVFNSSISLLSFSLVSLA